MGVLFRPRRPLLRMATGAATAGVAYHMGRGRAEQDMYNQEAQAAYQTSMQQQAPLPQPASQQSDTFSQLERLTQMHTAGQLSDAEFTAAKAQLLGV